MEVNSIDRAMHLIEANIIESFETGTVNFSHTVVRDKELLLPSHEHVFSISTVLVVEIWLLRLFGQRSPSRKACPVFHILLIAGTPVVMPGLEGVFRSNNLAFEKSGQGRVMRSKTYFSISL